MEKKIIKFIIIIIFIVIILIGLLIFSNAKNQKEKSEEFEDELELKPSNELKISEYNNYYITFNDYINKYFDYILSKNSKGILNLLSSDFINDEKISASNVLDNVDNINTNTTYNVKKIYELDTSVSVKNYFVYGYISNEETRNNGQKEKCNFVIKLDYENNSFSIAPYGKIFNNYIKYSDDKVEQKNTIDYEKMSKKIKSNDDNRIILENISDEKIVQKYFNLYIEDSRYYTKDAYNYLDEEFKQKRFGSFENYRNYIKNITNMLRTSKLEKYKVNYYDDYKEYICQDNYGNYYIFKETRPMEYTLILDIYTTKIAEISEKYDKSNNAQKTAINIEKFKQMINLKDYNSAYNVLDENFRNKNFGSVEKFEKYIKQNWPEFIDFKCSNYKEVNDVGTMDVKITGRGVSEEELNKVIEKTFIVKLLDENNFVMSFNVDE